MKKNILFAYPELFLGGSTTSLISILNSIDYSKYNVDLVLYRKNGVYLKSIPKEVNILNEVCKNNKNNFLKKLRFIVKYLLKGYLIKALFYELKYKKKFGLNIQVLSKISAKESYKVEKEYDAAIGYFEYWGNDYVLNNVNANKKIAWIHTDYEGAEFIPEIDLETFSKASKIVCVSKDCQKSCKRSFPSLTNKIIYMENIITKAQLINKSSETITDFDINIDSINIITVSRLSINTKGFDRIISAVKKLVDEGYKFKWYVIGDGPDRKKIEKLVYDNCLENNIFLLGKRLNPYPYIIKCDIFVMPSRYEGKPMAVTEAQILGLPIIVTKYESAKQQVKNGIDGLVVENNDVSIYYGIKKILDKPELLKQFKVNIEKRNLSNEKEIYKLYKMIE
ncbi:glycosyltransferase [Psychrobacillus sp. NPDC058041]|uniref:glycosyltransferase n=1 Tax=Psychrobacillus sp. NPDC058041 TaxID=3346310 RepID=UPI0036D7EA23